MDAERGYDVMRRMGFDIEAMETGVAGIQDLDPVRGLMAAAELLRAMGREAATAWVQGILATYEEAFGAPFEVKV